VFRETLKEIAPEPIPPVVCTVIHPGVPVTVQLQPAVVVIAIVPLAPADEEATLAGVTV